MMCNFSLGPLGVQARVVQKVFSAIHWINLYIHWMTHLVSQNLLDSDLFGGAPEYRCNNRGQNAKHEQKSSQNVCDKKKPVDLPSTIRMDFSISSQGTIGNWKGFA